MVVRIHYRDGFGNRILSALADAFSLWNGRSGRVSECLRRDSPLVSRSGAWAGVWNHLDGKSTGRRPGSPVGGANPGSLRLVSIVLCVWAFGSRLERCLVLVVPGLARRENRHR